MQKVVSLEWLLAAKSVGGATVTLPPLWLISLAAKSGLDFSLGLCFFHRWIYSECQASGCLSAPCLMHHVYKCLSQQSLLSFGVTWKPNTNMLKGKTAGRSGGGKAGDVEIDADRREALRVNDGLRNSLWQENERQREEAMLHHFANAQSFVFKSQEELKWNPIMLSLITFLSFKRSFPSPTWLIATNLRHLSWWLKKEHCNLKHLDICTWGKGKRGKLVGDSLYWTGSWELMSGSLLPSNKSARAFSRREKSFRSLYKLRWICSSELWHHKFLYADLFNMQVLIKAISGDVMKRSRICQPHRDEKQDWQRCWQDSMGCFMSTLVETNGRQRQHKLPQS